MRMWQIRKQLGLRTIKEMAAAMDCGETLLHYHIRCGNVPGPDQELGSRKVYSRPLADQLIHWWQTREKMKQLTS